MQRPDREQAFANNALALMGKCGVVPTPDNFALFYAHAVGENPSITQLMDQMIAAHKPFTPEILQDLRLCHHSSARAARQMEHLGGGISEVIGAVLGKLEAAGRHALDYTDALSAATGELEAEQSPADLRKLVDGLQTATQVMENRTKNLENELQRSSEQIEELRHKLDDVRKESLTDPLTGIANRKAFDNALDEAIARRAETQEPVSLLMCDIDRFKEFNDNWGHQTGDQVLRLVATCLTENLKGRDTAARYGGEEFAVLLRNVAMADAGRIAGQIRAAVECRKLIKKSTGNVLGVITISIGAAQLAPGETAEQFIRRADACLYGAKQNGRNLVVDQDDPRMAALEVNAA